MNLKDFRVHLLFDRFKCLEGYDFSGSFENISITIKRINLFPE